MLEAVYHGLIIYAACLPRATSQTRAQREEESRSYVRIRGRVNALQGTLRREHPAEFDLLPRLGPLVERFLDTSAREMEKFRQIMESMVANTEKLESATERSPAAGT